MIRSDINNLVLQIETRYRLMGEMLLRSRLVKPDNLKQVINQVIDELNPVGNISVSSMVLDLGTIPAVEFETEFNPRLAQALTENLLRLSEGARPPVEQPGSDPGTSSLAMSCLQPAALRELMATHPPERLLLFLKTLLISTATYREPAAQYAYLRVTASRLAIAALGFLLSDRVGLNWLRDHFPSVNQLEAWQDAIASGEIAVEQVIELLTRHNQLNAGMTYRWLGPLWQQKAVRSVVCKYAGTEGVKEIDIKLNGPLRPEQAAGNAPQPTDMLALQVVNAGVALLWPLLPQLFAHIELYQQEQFPGDLSRWQAVQSLHYLAWGGERPAAESFPLNQLLCGISPDAVMPDIAPLNEQQQQQIDRWLTAVGQRLPGWQRLSLSDIRALFLQRSGEVVYHTEPPQIIVYQEAFDYLLSDLPWPLTLVSLPWLEQPLTLIWPLPHLTG